MTKMILRNKQNDEWHAVYYLETVTNVIHGRYRDFYSKEDIGGNNVRPNDSVIIITFNDDSQASFGSDWEITFE